MRVLWTVNVIPAPLAKALELPAEVLGGWIEAMAAELSREENIELAIACKTDSEDSFRFVLAGITYYSLNYSRQNTKKNLKTRCDTIISEFKPDLIHIEGTEFKHAGAMLEAGEETGVPTVVSLQGILNGQYDYQCGHLPIDDMMWQWKNAIPAWLLHLRKTRWYRQRMGPERDLFIRAKNFIGRTEWDHAHTFFFNPEACYYACSRNLREPFYHIHWDIDTMERHSVYIGNGYYALKGLHFAVQAAALLCREYPDIKLYVAGTPPYSERDRRSFIKRGYGTYLRRLIMDLDMQDHVIFTGSLQAQEVAERLSRVNAYVLCSVAENSPNTLGEAMMVGTPCIASYVGGVPDMATDGEEVLIYRDDDPVMLAWKIKELFENDQLAISLSEKAKKRARLTHDRERNAAQLVRIYHSILERERKP